MSCLYGVFGDISPALTFSCISKLLLSDVVYHGGIYWRKKKKKKNKSFYISICKLLPYMFTEHERQISCEMEIKSLL